MAEDRVVIQLPGDLTDIDLADDATVVVKVTDVPTVVVSQLGPTGARGRGWISGSGAPSDSDGFDGDFYFDRSLGAWYGPKTDGSWSGTGPHVLGQVRDAVIGITDPNGADLDSLGVTPGIYDFRWPGSLSGYGLLAVAAAVTEPSLSGAVEIGIRNSRTTNQVLSTNLTIDEDETDSITAASPAVIDPLNNEVQEADLLIIDLVQTGTGAKGLILSLTFAPI